MIGYIKHSFWWWSVLVAASLSVSSPAAGQTGFEQTDTNGDGTIDFEEFRERMKDNFFRADNDRDGVLSGDELDVLNPGRVPEADVDGDGSLSLYEFLNATAADFRDADKNGDDLLTPGDTQIQ